MGDTAGNLQSKVQRKSREREMSCSEILIICRYKRNMGGGGGGGGTGQH